MPQVPKPNHGIRIMETVTPLNIAKESEMLAALQDYYRFAHLPRHARTYLENHYENAGLHALVHGERLTQELPFLAISSWAHHFDVHVETFVEFLLSAFIRQEGGVFAEFCKASVYIWSASTNRSCDVASTVLASIPLEVDLLPILEGYSSLVGDPGPMLDKLRAKAAVYASDEDALDILAGEKDRELVAEWISMELVTARGLGHPVVFDLGKTTTFISRNSPLDGKEYFLHLNSPDFLKYYVSQTKEGQQQHEN